MMYYNVIYYLKMNILLHALLNDDVCYVKMFQR